MASGGNTVLALDLGLLFGDVPLDAAGRRYRLCGCGGVAREVALVGLVDLGGTGGAGIAMGHGAQGGSR